VKDLVAERWIVWKEPSPVASSVTKLISDLLSKVGIDLLGLNGNRYAVSSPAVSASGSRSPDPLAIATEAPHL